MIVINVMFQILSTCLGVTFLIKACFWRRHSRFQRWLCGLRFWLTFQRWCCPAFWKQEWESVLPACFGGWTSAMRSSLKHKTRTRSWLCLQTLKKYFISISRMWRMGYWENFSSGLSLEPLESCHGALMQCGMWGWKSGPWVPCDTDTYMHTHLN